VRQHVIKLTCLHVSVIWRLALPILPFILVNLPIHLAGLNVSDHPLSFLLSLFNSFLPPFILPVFFSLAVSWQPFSSSFFLYPCFHQFISACCLCIRTQFLPAKQMATHSHQTRTRQFWTQKHNASYLSQMLSKLIVITCNAWPVEVTSTRTLPISYSKMHVTKLPLCRTKDRLSNQWSKLHGYTDRSTVHVPAAMTESDSHAVCKISKRKSIHYLFLIIYCGVLKDDLDSTVL